MTKQKTNLPLYLGLAVAIGILIGSLFNFNNKLNLFSSNSSEAKIKRLINYIQYDYVDEVDTDGLLDDAITTMLLKLDPHSVYIPKEELQQVTENMQGKFVGIGVSFLRYQDTVAVTAVIPNGPSEKAGIKAGDRIIAANNDSLIGMDFNDRAGIKDTDLNYIKNNKANPLIMKSLKGQPDTEVKVTVYRRSTDEILEIPIIRDEVPIKSVTGHYMINEHLGYINVDRFARTTYIEFKEALDALINEGMSSLVLDLTGNPGGYMDIANRIVDEFLEDGKLIVFTRNKNGDVDKSFATKRGDFEDGKVYVLINENSASASEIVAGALQDNDKGIIVGRRSFGKGLVQQEMDLGDGSAVRLTTSRYYTPTGRSIQKPYVKDDKNGDYENDYANRVTNGELFSKDSILVNDSLKFTTPKGKIVYGGGGIVPDVFVPIDSLNTYSRRLYSRLNGFVFRYIDTHREEMNKWELDDFVENFDKDDTVLNEYIDALDLKFPLAPNTRKNLKIYFNAVMARDLFDQLGYFKITHKTNDMILRILEIEAQGYEPVKE